MKILFCTDLSEPPAVTQGVEELVERTGAELLVLHVMAPAVPLDPDAAGTAADPVTGMGGFSPYTSYEPELQENLKKAEEHAFHDFLTSRFSRPLRAALRQGTPAEVILEDADRHEVTLLAMGKHHRGALERLLLGSTAEKVLKKSTRPVLLLPIIEEKT